MINPNKTTLGVNMPNALYETIRQKAGRMGVSKSKYAVLVLEDHVKAGRKLLLKDS